MKEIKIRFKGLFNKYVLLLLFTYFIFGVGGSYAYFAYQEENSTAIVGNVIAINATLDVELVVGNGGKLVPMLNRGLADAIKGTGGNAACVDNVGNLSCQVYKITLTNNGSRLQHVVGTIELYAKEGSGNVYNNLRWQELTNSTTIKTGSNVNRMGKSVLEKEITMESGETREWYIAVWISERDYDQKNTDKGLFGGTVTFETIQLSDNFSNAPNLDNGNLLPVYYDDTVQATDGTYGVWKKADSSNKNNSWYDYSNKMWANAVITDPEATTNYTTQPIGTTINDSDIIAFYVWIPRYKYRVWNITRQGGYESTYAYPAYTNGIDIEFEYFEGATGNIDCNYDIATEESEDNLADKCYYNGSKTPITTTDLNTNYTDAWYTHPAFTFGGEEVEGFWIGKFETTGETSVPTILPDRISLTDQIQSEQFTSSKKFQNYLSNNIDAHMITNLEWGAVAYLTHSIYGLCNGINCNGVNHNNSSMYTGRSGGAIAGSDNLSAANVYGSDIVSSLGQFSDNGYYNYKGYKLDYTTGQITTKDITKTASTTKNITGIYDLSGGLGECVMGNMVDINNDFYPSGSGISWNGSTKLEKKYYNEYSYGINYSKQKTYNRARLGDATAEILGGTTSKSSWHPETGITGSHSFFVLNSSSWFARSSLYDLEYNGLFSFDSSDGGCGLGYTFRSVLS